MLRNFFKKFRKNDTVIDLSDLQKRGLLEKETAIKQDSNSDSIVDLTKSSSSSSDGGSALGFLGSLAGASANENSSEPIESTPSSPLLSSPSLLSSTGKQKLRGILRDLKAKIGASSDKIYKLSDRLDLIERKIERLERRASV